MTKFKASKKENMKTYFLASIMLISTNLFSQEKPKSMPNNGSNYTEWTINDYDNFVENESEKCASGNKYIIAQEKHNLELETGLLKSKIYNKEIDENDFNKSISSLQTNYDNTIIQLDKQCSE
jgi:hypothetical protein